MNDDKRFQLALSLTPGVGNVNTKNLISYCGSATAVFSIKTAHLNKIPGIGVKTIASIKNGSIIHEADKILEDCEKNQIQIYHYTDENYPARLKTIADAPSIIYASGKGNFNTKKILAIVGTRNATEYGLEITRKIIADLAGSDVLIISGLAYGVDIEAHKACLEMGVSTYGIMANGHHKIYPSQHKKIASKMLDTGGLISENPPNKQAQAHFFPARNRIIAGMSDAVLVVEAAAKGGALITANIADSYDKYVFAVPGTIGSKYSEGCNNLIRNQKAYIYTGVKDLNYYLNWDQNEIITLQKIIDRDLFSLDELKVYDLLASINEAVHIDSIAWKTQLLINEVAAHLLTLEFKGMVKSLPGKKFKLI
jgi:DNA processing protein